MVVAWLVGKWLVQDIHQLIQSTVDQQSLIAVALQKLLLLQRLLVHQESLVLELVVPVLIVVIL